MNLDFKLEMDGIEINTGISNIDDIEVVNSKYDIGELKKSLTQEFSIKLNLDLVNIKRFRQFMKRFRLPRKLKKHRKTLWKSQRENGFVTRKQLKRAKVIIL